MSAAAEFQLGFATPVQTAQFTAPEQTAQFATLSASKKRSLSTARTEVLRFSNQQSARLGELRNYWAHVRVQSMAGQPAPALWVFTSTGLNLVNVNLRGQGIKGAVDLRLREFQSEGLISGFDQMSMTADALIYSVTLPQERWSSENRRRIHAAALGLQRQHGTVVLFELRRERVRAEGF